MKVHTDDANVYPGNATGDEVDADRSQPLAGMTVIEFGQLIAAPVAAMVLAGFGAQVIKVESLAGDSGRGLGSRGIPAGETGPIFDAFNGSKSSIALDLKSPNGLDIAQRLLQRADALIHGLRPGAMERLGLGPEDVRLSNPNLVYGSISAFGESGPNRSRGGVDVIMQAESGLMSTTGVEGGPPLRVGATIVDIAAGNILALGIVAALLGRERGGGGEVVSVSLWDVALHLQAGNYAEFLADGIEPIRSGNTVRHAAPAGLVQVADGEIMLSAYQGPHWQALCRIIDRSDLATDPRFVSSDLRLQNRDELMTELESSLRARSAEHWIRELTNAGIAVGRVQSYSEVVASEQSLSAGSVRTLRRSDGTESRLIRYPVQLGSSTQEFAAPRLGEHTQKILTSLNISAAEQQALVEAGIVR